MSLSPATRKPPMDSLVFHWFLFLFLCWRVNNKNVNCNIIIWLVSLDVNKRFTKEISLFRTQKKKITYIFTILYLSCTRWSICIIIPSYWCKTTALSLSMKLDINKTIDVAKVANKSIICLKSFNIIKFLSITTCQIFIYFCLYHTLINTMFQW